MKTTSLLTIVFAVLSTRGIAAEKNAPVSSKGLPEQLVREYILQHPEVLIESLQNYQLRQKAAEQQRAKEAVAGQQEALLHAPGSPVAGSKDGTTLVEFFDYRCGYCKKVDPVLAELMANNPNLRVVYKLLPILGPESLTAAKAGLAANKQGAYPGFHQALLGATDPITIEWIEKLAGQLGLDAAKLKADMNSAEVEKEISDNMNLSQALNIRATPTFVIGSEVIPGAVDGAQLQALIARAEAERKSATLAAPAAR